MSEAVFGTVVGLLLGAVLTSIGFLIKIHLERNAFINEALFALLELYRLLRLVTGLDIRRAIDVAYAELHRLLPNEGAEEAKKQCTPHILEMTSRILDTNWKSFEATIGAQYHEACRKVAAVNPLLAVRIHGALYLKAAIPEVDQYLRTMRDLASDPGNPEILQRMDKTSAAARSYSSDMYLKKLQADILAVAWAAGLTIFIKCWWKICKHNQAAIQDEFDNLLKQWVSRVVAGGGGRIAPQA